MPSSPRKPREWAEQFDKFGDYPHGRFDESQASSTDERADLNAAKIQDRLAWEVKRRIGGDSAKNAELAAQLGYKKPDSLRAMLRGESRMSLSTMFKIAEILEIPLHVDVNGKALP